MQINVIQQDVENLEHAICNATHAEPDFYTPVKQWWKAKSNSYQGQFSPEMLNVLDTFDAPEISLLNEFSPTLYGQNLDLDHPFFQKVRTVPNILRSVASEPTVNIQDHLKNAAETYELYFKELIKTKLLSKKRAVLLEPKVIMATDSVKFYRISQQKAREILGLDLYGVPQPKPNAHGNGTAIQIGDVFFKSGGLNTIEAVKDFTGYAFHTLLWGEGAVPSSLITLSNIQIWKEKLGQNSELILEKTHHPIEFALASKAVPGRDLQHFLEDTFQTPQQRNQLDFNSFCQHVLTGLLTCPTDARFDNYVVKAPAYTLVKIDADREFSFPFIRGKHEENNFLKIKHEINYINYLHFLTDFMNRPLPQFIKQQFCSYPLESTILDWFKIVQDKQSRMDRLQHLQQWGPNFGKINFSPIGFTHFSIQRLLENGKQSRVLLASSQDFTCKQLLKHFSPIGHEHSLPDNFDVRASLEDVKKALERNRKRYAERLKAEQLEAEKKRAEKAQAERSKAEKERAKPYDPFNMALYRPMEIPNIFQETNKDLAAQRKRVAASLSSEICRLDTLRFPDDYQDWQYTGLAIDGGGIRGLIPASILEKIEDHLPKGQPVAQLFDAVGGVSIGGILALGLTVPEKKYTLRAKYRASEMVDLFKTRGKEIFPVPFYGKKLLKLKQIFLTNGYPAEPLEKLLQEYFGDMHISDSVTAVLVGGAINNSQNPNSQINYPPYLFKSYAAQNNPWEDYLTWQIGRATSAAPSYFPNYKIFPDFHLSETGWNSKEMVQEEHGRIMVDGGLASNNPAKKVIEYIEEIMGKRLKGLDEDRIKHATFLLSLGTGLTYLDPSEVMPISSAALWATKPIITAEMQTKLRGEHERCYEILGSNYYRLDPKIDKVIDLADVSEENLNLLEQSTDRYEDFCETMARRLLINKDNRQALDSAIL